MLLEGGGLTEHDEPRRLNTVNATNTVGTIVKMTTTMYLKSDSLTPAVVPTKMRHVDAAYHANWLQVNGSEFNDHCLWQWQRKEVRKIRKHRWLFHC